MVEKLTEKANTYHILRNAGKSIQEAYKLSGFKGLPTGSAPYKLEQRIKNFALTEPKLLRKSQKVAKHILEIAEKALRERRNDKGIQDLCIKSLIQLIKDQQDRVDPKKNVNLNINLNVDTSDFIDLSAYRYRGDQETGKRDVHPL